jgi:hypothetical protein
MMNDPMQEQPMPQPGMEQGGGMMEPGMDDGSNVTPEEQAQFDALQDEIILMLDQPEMFEKLVGLLQSNIEAGEPAQGFALAIVTTLDALEDKVGQLEDDYLINLAEFLSGHLAELAEDAGLAEVTEDLMGEIIATAIQMWMQEHPDRVDMDEESMAMAQQAASEMQGGQGQAMPQGGQPPGMAQPMPEQQPRGLLGSA